MNNNKEYETIYQKMDLVEYIYYLQYEMENDDILVKTKDADFLVWEGSTFKVNGEEFTTAEFYEMLSSMWEQAACNGQDFEYINNKFTSINEIEVRREKISRIIKL
ncbi:hypothetical protein MHH60_20495 [Paenibacillus sp. FSL H7-0716]|uniref:Uncharacterized protein n=1 Tax=Paenibacillus odorifer TaxID=189426 RepID=A0AB36JBK3_9BACL|nr:hypothetical protein [Paenibacillus odorifer]OME16585.1 hypothetical protein BSK47_20215 [Paenibacillus odorifer]